MPRFGVHVRDLNEAARTAAPINWRGGVVARLAAGIRRLDHGLRYVFLILYGIQGGFRAAAEFTAIPVLLIGPPIALLLFGLMAGWAFRGFKPK